MIYRFVFGVFEIFSVRCDKILRPRSHWLGPIRLVSLVGSWASTETLVAILLLSRHWRGDLEALLNAAPTFTQFCLIRRLVCLQCVVYVCVDCDQQLYTEFSLIIASSSDRFNGLLSLGIKAFQRKTLTFSWW